MYRGNEEWMQKLQLNVEQAKRYARLRIIMYDYRKEHGRYLLHEHPWLAASWCMPEMQKLEAAEGVTKVRTDMCQFGMSSRRGGVGSETGPVLKPTGFLTNSHHIGKELSRRCPRNHEHVPSVGGRAAAAAIYPRRLCCAICKGIAAQIAEDNSST